MKRPNLLVFAVLMLVLNAAFALAGPIEYGAASEVVPVRPWLGITVQNLDESAARTLGAYENEGVLVSEVMDDGPADKAGLKAGDIIVRVDGKAVSGPQEFVSMIRGGIIGNVAVLTVNRAGEIQDLSVILGKMPELMGLGGYHHGVTKPEPPYGRYGDLDRGGEYGPGNGKYPRNYGKIYSWALDNLKLGPEERKKVQALYGDYRKKTIKAVAEIEIAEVELSEMLDVDAVNIEKVKTKLGEIASKKAELRFYRIKSLQDLKRLLSDEDRTRLKEMLR